MSHKHALSEIIEELDVLCAQWQGFDDTRKSERKDKPKRKTPPQKMPAQSKTSTNNSRIGQPS